MHNQLWAWGASIVLFFIGGKLAHSLVVATKYLKVARDFIDGLDDMVAALKDNTLTPEEIQQLKNDIAKVQVDLKG